VPETSKESKESKKERKKERKKKEKKRRKIYEVNWDKFPSDFIHLFSFHNCTTDNTNQFEY